jgi:phosphate transport system substrate-binding protein
VGLPRNDSTNWFVHGFAGVDRRLGHFGSNRCGIRDTRSGIEADISRILHPASRISKHAVAETMIKADSPNPPCNSWHRVGTLENRIRRLFYESLSVIPVEAGIQAIVLASGLRLNDAAAPRLTFIVGCGPVVMTVSIRSAMVKISLRSWLRIPRLSPTRFVEGCSVLSTLMGWLVCAGALVILFAGLAACRDQRGAGSQQPGSGSQTIENKGSDTLVNLALAWAESYMHDHPEIRISVTGGGSGTGIAALLNGTVDLANASREMKSEEIKAAQAKGFTPVELVVARDAIVVVANPSNPVTGLTMQQISDIYTGKITNWREVGGQDRPIVLLSRESNSGTYVYFLENVIRMSDSKSKLLFSPDTLLMPSSEGISVEVRQNPNAIGYDGLGYVTPDQKVLGVAANADSAYVLPSVATVNDGSYPISRPLFVYTAGEPGGQLKNYLDWVLGPGQSVVPKLGFVPLYRGP